MIGHCFLNIIKRNWIILAALGPVFVRKRITDLFHPAGFITDIVGCQMFFKWNGNKGFLPHLESLVLSGLTPWALRHTSSRFHQCFLKSSKCFATENVAGTPAVVSLLRRSDISPKITWLRSVQLGQHITKIFDDDVSVVVRFQELACVQPPPPLRKILRFFMRGGGSCTQAINQSASLR